ncbi:lovastatin nonaketide synthase [Xylariaceae sp. FL0804]|nr:lovastatin nonaketide synthase [Xylariaceae sp. FL0804]
MVKTNPEPIAIVGSGCRFPGGANSPSALWKLLETPRDVCQEIPPDRFSTAGFYHPNGTRHGATNVRHTYLLQEDVRLFDAAFFNISPNEADSIDPQQRILMETVYEALEAGGHTVERLRGSDTAVYVGTMGVDYHETLLRDLNTIPTYFATGTNRAIISNRISYFFDWHGPSMTIDTACSSSLIAVHQGVQTLRSRESRIAVACGTQVILGHEMYIVESKLKMLSPTGRSRMWDADADGYARGEGVAAIVMKRLSDAIADGDHIECLIRETGANQDGFSNGLTVPNTEAQSALIRQTYARAGLDPENNPADRPQYFEAHGTGTQAGDPKEAAAIHEAFGRHIAASSTTPLYVGSIKTVVGHLEGAAGLAGLLKGSSSIQKALIAPNLLFNRLNPRVEPFYQGLHVPTSATPWPELPKGVPRRVSVNSFGFGGANAHAILEEHVQTRSPELRSRNPTTHCTPFLFSALSEASLVALLKQYSESLKTRHDDDHVDPSDLAWTLHARRSRLPVKTAFSAQTLENLASKIDKKLAAAEQNAGTTVGTRSTSKATAPRILGVFTGQGAQWPAMGAQLIRSSPFVRQKIQGLEESLNRLPPSDRPQWSLVGEMLAGDDTSRIAEAALSQPLCTALQIILVDLLCAAGIRFSSVVGHSSGEIAAAYAAGFLSAHDAIRVAYYRGLYARLAGNPQNSQKGAMLAVGTSLEDAEELISQAFKGKLAVAAHNSPASVTLSGDVDCIIHAQKIFIEEKKFARTLKVDTAYHSHHMLPCGDPYVQALRACGIRVNRNSDMTCKWYSSVVPGTGAMQPNEELRDVYWRDNMTNAVLFADAVKNAILDNEQIDLALEVGPHPALKGPAIQNIAEVTPATVPYSGVLMRGEHDVEAFADALGCAWTNLGGKGVDLQAFEDAMIGEAQPHRLVVGLPSYQWNHGKVYWTESRKSRNTRGRRETPHELLGAPSPDSNAHDMRWSNVLKLSEISWLKGHQLQGQVVFPAAGYVAMALEAARSLAIDKLVELFELHNLVIPKAITFEEDDTLGVETLVTLTAIEKQRNQSIAAEFSIYSCPVANVSAEHDLELMATGNVKIFLGQPGDAVLASSPAPDYNMSAVDHDRFYAALSELGYGYSDSFRGMSAMKRKLNYSSAIVDTYQYADDETTSYMVHPSMLDVAFQSSMLAFSAPGDGRLWSLHVPTAIRTIRVDPMTCASLPSLGSPKSSVPVYATLDSESESFAASIDLFSENGQRCMIQVEDLVIKPFAPATERDDRRLFSHTRFDLAAPDGSAVMQSIRPSAEEVELGTVCERISYHYLRKWKSELTDDEWIGGPSHYRLLRDFVDHTLSNAYGGQHPTLNKTWTQDSAHDMADLIAKHSDDIDVQLLHAVGENMPAAVRGQTTILEHMLPNNMLDNFYRHGLGFARYNAFLAGMVKQITHRYPHAKILEIGAGTGGATKSVLEAIGSTMTSYTYTDISVGFFTRAAEAFKAYSDKMTFKVLDVEKAPAAQGYQSHSYDIIVASNVLHATVSLQKTLEHTRQLLKPGGYLMLLEITDNDPIRCSTIMGGLPGWWLGVDDGRRFAPTTSPAVWHSTLRKAGFGGVDAITPKVDGPAWPFSIIAAQAVDDRILYLRRPLSSPSPMVFVESLIILGTESLGSARIAEDVANSLGRFCGKTTILSTLPSEDEALELPPGSTFINLVDLDFPIFKDFTGDKMEGLKRLFDRAKHVLWITQGALTEEPYHMASLAFGRSISNEATHVSLNFLDLSDLDHTVSTVIAEQLLRQCALDDWDEQQLLWSMEPESFLIRGKISVPRLLHNIEQNSRLNSSRRVIRKTVPVSQSNFSISHNGTSLPFLIEDALPPNKVTGPVLTTEASSMMALGVAPDVFLFPVIGRDSATGKNAAALSATNSRTVAPVVSVPLDVVDIRSTPEVFLALISSELLASSLVQSLPPSSIILMRYSRNQQLLADTVSRQAQTRGVRVIVACDTECEYDARDHNTYIKLDARAPRYTVRRKLLSAMPTHYLDLQYSEGLPDNSGRRIAQSLPPGCRQIDASVLFRCQALYPPSVHREVLVGLLDDAVTRARMCASRVAEQYAQGLVLEMDRIHEWHTPQNTAHVVRWPTANEVRVEMRAFDTQTLFSKEKTYICFGLSGQIGQSLCDWMVSNGAGTVLLTSRHPKVDQRWLESFKEGNATVEVFSVDVTDRTNLERFVEMVRATFPPIAGIANGAMVLSDALFSGMAFEAMRDVLTPKIDGSYNLDMVFHDDNLDFFVLFSSGACVVGNSGQSNYAAANGYLSGLARQRRSRGLAASTIDIGLVSGIGYVETASKHVVDQLGKYGMTVLSESDLRRAFAETVLTGYPKPEDATSVPDAVVTTGVRTMTAEATNVVWYSNPVFSHCILESSHTDSGAKDEAKNKAAALPVARRLPMAATKEEALHILQDSFSARLSVILQSADQEIDPEAPLVELGIDSLVAVEVRSWFLKELKVDIPVLKVVGGASLSEICDSAIKKLPEELLGAIGTETGDAAAQKPAEKPSTPDPDLKTHSPPAETSSSSVTEADFIQTERVATPESSSTQESSIDSSEKPPAAFRKFVDASVDHAGSAAEASSVGTRRTDVARSSMPRPRSTVRRAQLSPGQLRFFRLIEVLQSSVPLNIACLMRLDGPLQVDRLTAAMHTVARRHEALRTCFREGEDGQVLQTVFGESGILIEQGAVPDQPAARAEYDRLVRHSFDLENGECMRVSVLRQSFNVHFIIFAFNHVVMDGASFEVFWINLAQVYMGGILSPAVLQYADFAERQLGTIRSGELDEQLRFWREKVSPVLSQGPLPLLPFAETRQRQVLATYDFHSVKRTNSSSLTKSIQAACLQTKASGFHFYLAVFRVLLTQLLQLDGQLLCIGVADANRLESDTMDSIGNYVNVLPIVFQNGKNGSETFVDVLREVRTEVYKALANSRVTFDMLLEKLQVTRSASYTPIFQAFINYRTGVKERRSFGAAQAEVQAFDVAKTGYDISLDIINNPGGQATLSIMVQKSLYSESDAAMLMDLYVDLLEGVARSPTILAVDAPLYNERYGQRAIEAARGKTTRPPDLPTLPHRIQHVLEQSPNALALVDSNGTRLSYAAMAKRVDAIVAALGSRQLKTGSIVAVFQHPTADWVCSMLATMHLGLVYLPLDPKFPAARLRAVVDNCHPAVFIVNLTSKTEVGKLTIDEGQMITVEDCTQAKSRTPIQATPSMLAALLYTSGSTGIPKGILLRHEGLLNEVEDSAECFCITPDDVILQQSALTFDLSLWELFNALANGATAVVVCREHRMDPMAVTSLLLHEKVTIAMATVSEYTSWIRDGSAEAIIQSPLRLAVGMGEMKPGLRVYNAYGPAEASFIAEHGRRIRNPVGYTSQNCSIYIVDEKLRLLPIGFSGEVVIGGCGVADCYIHNDALTAEKFPTDPWAGPEQRTRGWTRMYRTGDRGFLDADGCLTIESRIRGDTEIKLRGIRIDVQDVEKAIVDTGRGAVRDAVVSLRGDGDAQYLVAHLVFNNSIVSESDRMKFYTTNLVARLPLPQYMCPALAIPLRVLPLNSSGKLNRGAVARLAVGEQEMGNGWVQDRSATLSKTELQLMQLWLRALPPGAADVTEITGDTDFFHAGGNSGSLVRLHRSIRQAFQVTFPLLQLFEASTLRAMATKIESQALPAGPIDWIAETAIDCDRIATEAADISNQSLLPAGSDSSKHGKVILLTGASGNLASVLLPLLTSDKGISTVYCVAIRDMAKAEAALSGMLEVHQRAKVQLYAGDLTMPRLGLGLDEFGRIMSEADAIVHLGAARAFWDDYQNLRAGNVTSVRELITLAAGRKVPIHFVSSGSVLKYRDDQNSTAAAQPPTDGSDAYVAAKWAVERILHSAARGLGLPVTIYRPLPTEAQPPDQDNVTRDELLNSFVRYARIISALPSDRVSAWDGSVSLTRLAAFAQLILDRVASSPPAADVVEAGTSSEQAEYNAIVNHRAELSATVVDIVAHLRAHGGDTAGFEQVDVLEWIGRLKRAGFPSMLAALLLTYRRDELGPALRLER